MPQTVAENSCRAFDKIGCQIESKAREGEPVDLDELDRAVLKLLSEDGRMSSRAVGAKLGIEATTAHRRVRSLEQRGVIQRYAPVVDPAAVGLGVTMFVRASPRGKVDPDGIPGRLSSIPEIEACYVTAGHDNILLLVHAPTFASTRTVLSRIERAGEVTTRVTMVLSKESTQSKASPNPAGAEHGPVRQLHRVAAPAAIPPGAHGKDRSAKHVSPIPPAAEVAGSIVHRNG